MRATCTVDELPKLKAYPWERVFPNGTPPRAMDLAARLLTYDPSQRLTAPQALQHPFLQDVEFLLSGDGAVGVQPQLDAATRAFEQQLQTLFQEYTTKRSGPIQNLLPTFERNLQNVLTGADAYGPAGHDAVMAEVEAVVRECQKAEDAALTELQQQVLATTRGQPVGRGRDASASTASASNSAATIEQLQAQAAEAREEAAQYRQQLDALQQQLAAAEQEYAVDVGGDGATASHGPTSGRRAAASTTQGTASPLCARASMVDGSEPSDGSARQPRSRLHMSSLAEDEMGQVTPVGIARDTQPTHGAPEEG